METTAGGEYVLEPHGPRSWHNRKQQRAHVRMYESHRKGDVQWSSHRNIITGRRTLYRERSTVRRVYGRFITRTMQMSKQ
jgi:hypothetical protein